MTPILSIITTTYNSASFVEETINAVLNQKVDFDFEYIISDDGSTDNTLEVIDNLKNNHRNGKSIRTIVNKKNQGVMKNFFGAVKQTSGDFIAFCDSDDVWGDRSKLQKQVDYMKAHSNVSITFHAYKNIAASDTNTSNFDGSLNLLIKGPQTSTMVVKGILRDKINFNVVNEAITLNDQYLRFLLQDEGRFVCLNGIKPNVRIVRENSIFSTIDALDRKSKALQSWQTFYKYHGIGKNKNYLARKVQGFTSAVKWLEYRRYNGFSRLKAALGYDLRTGIFIRQFKSYLRRIFLKPLVNMKHFFAENQKK